MIGCHPYSIIGRHMDSLHMSRLEELAVRLQTHLWENVGVTDEWPIQICGDDGAITKLIELLNEMQHELRVRGVAIENFNFEEASG